MPISRDLLDQLQHLLRPLSIRIHNMVSRSVIKLVNDSKKMQLVQLGGIFGGPYDDAERFEPFGLTSVPLVDAEAVVIFPNGDRSHPLVVATSDRRYRPRDGQPGDVTLWNVVDGATGAKIRLLATGDIEIQPAPGHEVRIATADGTAAELATKQDLDILRTALSSLPGGSGVISAMDSEVAALVPPPVPPTWPIGTKTLKGE